MVVFAYMNDSTNGGMTMKKTRLRIVQVCLSVIILLQAVLVTNGQWLLGYGYVGSVFMALNITCAFVVLHEFLSASNHSETSRDRDESDVNEPSVSPSR